MEKKKRRYWLPALVLLLIMAVVFGGMAGRKLKAKTQLTAALRKAFSQLEERFQGDPLLILAEYYHPEGKYTANMEAVTNQEILGTITYDMTVSADLNAHQIRAEGIARTPKQSIDLSAYLDSSFMAVSSDELANGDYYGITYDTFASDLRKIPLLDFIVNDAVLDRWNDSIQEIQGWVCREYPQPKLPELNGQEIQKLLLGIAAMPCQIRSGDIMIGTERLTCDELDYTINAEQITGVLSRFMGEKYGAETSAYFSFYLYGDTLVRVSLTGTSGGAPFQYCFDLNQDPTRDPLTLTGSYGNAQSISVQVSTQSSESHYVESWEIHTIGEGIEKDHSFSFDWVPQNGAMIFRSNQLPAPVFFNFQKTEQGLRLETEDLISLFQLVNQAETISSNAAKAACVLTISKGADIETPGYKNLDQWSMQDFLTLLAGVGSLVGIRLE